MSFHEKTYRILILAVLIITLILSIFYFNKSINQPEVIDDKIIENSITEIMDFREAAGNAVRHGKCKNLRVDLEIGYELVRLKIIDDGVGFDTDNLSPKNSGLGL